MANGINKVILVGNLARDPEIRYTEGGVAIANITVVTSKSWKDKNSGEKKEKAEFHRVVAYRQTAEIIGKYLKKGSQVYVEGELQTTAWEKDGVKRYTTEVIVKDMQMLGGGQRSDNNGAASGNQDKPKPDNFDDSIPF